MQRSATGGFAACLLGLGMPAGVCAVEAPEPVDPAAAVQRQAQQWQQLRERNEAAPEISLQGAPERPAHRLPVERACREIRSVRFAGELSGLRALRRALSGPSADDLPEGRCLGAAGIQMLAERAQNALLGLGFITSRVHAHPQSLSGGELVLTIEAGRIGDLRAFGMGTAIPRMTAAREIRPGSVLNLRDIEQTLENLRRNPDALVNIEVSPGTLPGHSDISIEYVPRQPLRLRFFIDDSGSRATGKLQANATIAWNDPLGLADSMYIAVGRDVGGHAAGARGSEYAMLHYSVPFGYWLLSTTANVSRQHRAFAGSTQAHQYHEMSRHTEVTLSRVVQRSASSKTSVSAKAYAYRSRSLIDDTEVEVQRRRTGGWEAAMRHTAYLTHGFGQGTLEARLGVRHGTGAFGATAAPEAQAGEGSIRARLIDSWLHLRVPFVSGVTGAKGKTGMTGALQYHGQLRAQWGLDPLAPQDRICIGGRHTVRGFDGENSLCGNRALVWRNEISGSPGWNALNVYCAVDMGLVDGQGRAERSGRRLAGAAIGVRVELPAWSAGSVHGDLFIGAPLHQPAGFGSAPLTAGFSFGVDF